MKYLALGDSISIDYYTEVDGGGAASQFARSIGASGNEFQNFTRDGNVCTAVLIDLKQVTIQPQVVTLTIGGNDLLLLREDVCRIIPTIERIATRLRDFGCTVIMNTVYDPTDGSDAVGKRWDIPEDLRREYNALNGSIRRIAADNGFLLADLEELFHGHGVVSQDPWFVQVIEPNLSGATAIAAKWQELIQQQR